MSHPLRFTGLTEAQAVASRNRWGSNEPGKPPGNVWPVVREIISEPLFLLLVATSVIYFLLGKVDEAVFMVIAILLVSAISFFQDRRSRKALETLKAFTRIRCKVVRDGKVREVPSEEIVIGDYVVLEEGMLIPADGTVRQSNDFTVNESILTGESFTVAKDASDPKSGNVFQGTLVSSGMAVFEVTAVGAQTHLGKIGKSLAGIREEKTPLQEQIGVFVRRMAVAGIAVFLLIWLFNFLQSHDVLTSLLRGLTLAMSILPEEIPVAFATFMALGAWRLMKKGIVVKQVKTVETLGSATIICIDKTGTITENRMELQKIYVHAMNRILSEPEWRSAEAKKVIEVAMWASEPAPFDPMEKALHAIYGSLTNRDLRGSASMVHEYPLSGKPPMMTHIFRTQEKTIVAAKGAPEILVRHSSLADNQKKIVIQQGERLAAEGYRVLAVGEASGHEPYPAEQTDFVFEFLGFVAFFDPPKANIREVLTNFYRAGLQVKIITGDNERTTSAIAATIGMKNPHVTIGGDALMHMDDVEVMQAVKTSDIFTRMFPEAKLRIINALKKQKQVVAMTGDGVNDGPALKAAHIGIAMGKRGTEVAKQASALVLTEDDLSKLVEAIAMGRRIYSNLKKAIQYIISIHIPIILTVSLPLFLGWIYPDIFTPVHVIFLELIMGPTCSIVYENEPMEATTMQQPPRDITFSFLAWRDLRISIAQGLMITAGTLGAYQYAVSEGIGEEATRSMVFVALIVANIFLTLTNRSFYDSMLSVIRYKNSLMRAVIGVTIGLLLLILYIPALNNFFHLQPVSLPNLAVASGLGFASAIWFEIYKFFKRSRIPKAA